MAGNTLGQRGYFDYTDDGGEPFSLLTDRDLGAAGGLTLSTSISSPPRRFKPRGVYAEATIAGRKVRKFIPCAADSALYGDSSQTVTIDGQAFVTTGRVGEKLTFGRNA